MRSRASSTGTLRTQVWGLTRGGMSGTGMMRGATCRFSGLYEGFFSWVQGWVGEATGHFGYRAHLALSSFLFFSFHHVYSLCALSIFLCLIIPLFFCLGWEGGCKGHRGYWAEDLLILFFFRDVFYLLSFSSFVQLFRYLFSRIFDSSTSGRNARQGTVSYGLRVRLDAVL